MFTVYALDSLNKNYIYVGMTNAFDRRFKQHNTGKVKTTRAYAPFNLLHTEVYATRSEARIREQQLKSGFGKEYLKKLR